MFYQLSHMHVHVHSFWTGSCCTCTCHSPCVCLCVCIHAYPVPFFGCSSSNLCILIQLAPPTVDLLSYCPLTTINGRVLVHVRVCGLKVWEVWQGDYYYVAYSSIICCYQQVPVFLYFLLVCPSVPCFLNLSLCTRLTLIVYWCSLRLCVSKYTFQMLHITQLIDKPISQHYLHM